MLFLIVFLFYVFWCMWYVFIKVNCNVSLKMVRESVGLLPEIECCFYMGTSNLTLDLRSILLGCV